MATQTVEQFLFEQLEKIAPGKYTLANVLQLFKTRLRFPCTHLKGGRTQTPFGKDYNLSIFTFPTGVTEIKCLYNCGLKVRSDQPEFRKAFDELSGYSTTNSPAACERQYLMKGGKPLPIDPGPTPTYTDEQRERIKASNDLFLSRLELARQLGILKPQDLGGERPHPNPIEAPDSIVERGIKQAFGKAKNKAVKAFVTFVDKLPAPEDLEEPKAGPEPVKSNKKIRKARKTQSRRKRGG